MSLGVKIPLILMVVVMLYGVLDASIQSWVLEPSFAALERQQAGKDLARCLGAFRREIAQLDRTCLDWAARDEAYEYVNPPAQGIEVPRLAASVFEDNRIDLLFVLDSGNRVRWRRVRHLETKDAVNLPEFPDTQWDASHPILRSMRGKGEASGVFLTDAGPWVVAAYAIPGTGRTGSARGTMVLGRLMDGRFVNALSEQTQVNVQFRPLIQGKIATEDQAVLDQVSSRFPYAFSNEEGGVLHVATVFPDLLENPALVVRAYVPCAIQDQGSRALAFARWSTVMAGILVFLAVLILLRSAVINPILLLRHQVAAINKDEDLAMLPFASGNDEIGGLAKEFGQMGQRILQAQQALREGGERLRAIIETAPDAIITIDQDGRIESFNPAAERVFGYVAAEALGQHLDTMIPDTPLTGYTESGETAGRETMGVRKDGTAFPLYWTVNPVPFGERRLFTGIARDITDLKEMHEKVLRAEHLASLGEMGASVAHEIRNPLAGISGAMQVLRDGFDEGDSRRAVMDEVVQQVNRLDAIVNRLLLFAKVWTPEKRPVDLREIAARVSRDAQAQAAWRGIAFHFTGEAGIEAPADAALVEQVFWNLLNNAREAMAANGDDSPPREVHWSFSLSPGFAVVTLRDTGPGVLDEARDRLFRPFYSTKTYGTGLGLAICRRILEAHGGTATVANDPGGGAEVTLRFPIGS